MIKRKIGVDNNVALNNACENNDIILTAKDVNAKPVSYIDQKGRRKILDAKFCVDDRVKISGDLHIKKAGRFGVGDTVKVYSRSKEGNRERFQVAECVVLKRQDDDNEFTMRITPNDILAEASMPLYSNSERLAAIRKNKVRRSKLKYEKSRVGKKKRGKS